MNHQFKNWTNGTNTPNGWPTPEGRSWICGKLAYAYLPKNWTGSCVLGTIRPSFFLLPRVRGEQLGVPVYAEADELRKRRHKRSLQMEIGNIMNGLPKESLPIMIQLRGQKMDPGVIGPQYICLIE